MPFFGYARVSTRDQDLAAQDAELRAAGCAKVFKEKASGAKTDRPELAKVINRLEPGDVLVVTRLDRLGRSLRPTYRAGLPRPSRPAAHRPLHAGFRTSVRGALEVRERVVCGGCCARICGRMLLVA